MKLKTLGKDISEVDISNISVHGLWLFVNEKEYFLSYEQYPWFKDAKICDILDVQLLHQFHLYWPRLDVDLEITSLDNQNQYPLVYK